MTHTCHAEGCHKSVAPRMLFCIAHWRLLPARLKVSVLRAYRPGQEVDKTPSAEYLVAQRKACMWVAVKEGRRTVEDAAVEVMRWIPEAKAFTNIARRGPLSAAELVDEMNSRHANAGLVALAEAVLDEMKGAAS